MKGEVVISMCEKHINQDLIEQAKDALHCAYVPYSEFKVGAAVYTNGKIYKGCNIENASFGLTNCAERTAIFKAVSEGHKEIDAIAVIADTVGPVSPCGACRQVMAEFCNQDTIIYLTNFKGETKEYTISELLPGSFQATDMDK